MGTAPNTRRRRNQGGLTLLEVIFVAAIIALVATTIAAWSTATLVSGAQTQARNDETNALSLVNSHMLRDITSAQFAATNADLAAPTDLADCPAPATGTNDGASDEPVLVLVSGGDRRIVCTVVDGDPAAGDKCRVLYRR